ncbi:hypothetical protein A2U01_0116870 [Trifolium medium]|uniref:Uncharacterized protein n=1 Tax=Trifolium medium TaxID=97028 RepID=A0A392W768_9FABA|nr:hypothetical protein [Trifolium medium]
MHGGGLQDRRIVRSYELDRDSDYHGGTNYYGEDDRISP